MSNLDTLRLEAARHGCDVVNMPATALKTVDAIREAGPLTAVELAELLNIERTAAFERLKGLGRRRLVRPMSSKPIVRGQGVAWQLTRMGFELAERITT